MLCVLIAVLYALLACDRVTSTSSKCTDKACFTLHTEKVTFQTANTNCVDNGGYLVTVRDHNDLQAVKSLLQSAGKLSVQEKCWIALKLSKGSCVLSDQGLHGFRWLHGEPVSSYSNWGKEPRSTCTEERCVSLSTVTEQLKWSDGSCKERALYMCVYYFKGMCKPLLLAGPGEVNYTFPLFSVPLKPDNGLLPHGTFADVRCAGSDMSTSVSVCKESGAHFVWEAPGPFCASTQRSCTNRNGGCDQLCLRNDDTGVRCGCTKDYYLGDDQVTCFHRDACRSSPCQHKCAAERTGFVCSCLEGFELSKDQINCIDVDECTQDMCSGHICHNKQGGYECECKKGFKNVDGTCEDIDECAQSACAHHGKCLNTEGSFSCSCFPGYRKYRNKCVDINECLSGPCEGNCTNTDGSYMCTCGSGLRLDGNGIKCVPDQKRATTSTDLKIILTEGLDQTAVITVTPSLSTDTTAETRQSVRKDGPVVGSWVLVYALSSVIPLLLVITLTAVIAVHRWNRSRKDAKKKSVTTDSYCWVSSGYTADTETPQNTIY